jgi:hypothetical protein
MTKTEEAIQSVIQKINDKPYIFHTESDIRAMLYAELIKRYPDFYEISLSSKSGKKNETLVVHTEYFGGEGKRIDTVVFSENGVESINTNYLQVRRNGKSLPVELEDAVEIKFSTGRGERALTGEIDKDIQKLTKRMGEKGIKHAYYLLIFREPTNNKRKQRWLIGLAENTKDKCINNNIRFHCNDFQKLFPNRP